MSKVARRTLVHLLLLERSRAVEVGHEKVSRWREKAVRREKRWRGERRAKDEMQEIINGGPPVCRLPLVRWGKNLAGRGPEIPRPIEPSRRLLGCFVSTCNARQRDVEATATSDGLTKNQPSVSPPPAEAATSGEGRLRSAVRHGHFPLQRFTVTAGPPFQTAHGFVLGEG